MSEAFEKWKQEYRNINNCGLDEIFLPNEWAWHWIELAFEAGASAARKEAFEETVKLIDGYMKLCEQQASDHSGKEDEISQRMYWRCDGAADALGHIANKIKEELSAPIASKEGQN